MYFCLWFAPLAKGKVTQRHVYLLVFAPSYCSSRVGGCEREKIPTFGMQDAGGKFVTTLNFEIFSLAN
jgi:hypothetical protein